MLRSFGSRFALCTLLVSTVVAPPGNADPKYRVLYTFCSKTNCSDGDDPEAGLIADMAGNLYGTTAGGGTQGYGTVFRLAPDGTETVLYSFSGGTDGTYPHAGLIVDGSGNFYGTTSGGGTDGCEGYGCGTVFKLAPDGTETVLYVFQGGSDGGNPDAGLIMDGSGNLYGSTAGGGGSGCYGGGCGTVFRLAPDGT